MIGDPRLPVHFWNKIAEPAGEDDCWIWVGARMRTGYGTVTVGGRTKICHRFVYEALVGPIPEGLQIDHLCLVKPCVNPAHLEAVTGLENMRRRAALQTRCPNGHEYAPEDTVPRLGYRKCRICLRAAWTRANRKKAGAA